MKSLIAAALALTFTASAFAGSASAKPSPAPAPRVVPESVIQPVNLPLDFNGALIKIEFSLDASGQPRDIEVQSVKDAAVKRQVLKAFRQWRFESLARHDQTQPQRFVLPLQVNAEA